MAREVEPKLANNFLKSDNPGVVMTSAEVKFLMAEATVKKWNVGSVSAEELYKQGVRAAMDFLTDNYGCTATTDAEFENCLTILTALEELERIGYRILPKDYLNGFSDVCQLTGLMGRWQKVYSYPDIICDTGHNVDGIKYICEQLDFYQQTLKQQLHFVFGMVNDKDISSVLKLLPKNAIYYFTKASVKRALPENELLKQAEEAG